MKDRIIIATEYNLDPYLRPISIKITDGNRVFFPRLSRYLKGGEGARKRHLLKLIDARTRHRGGMDGAAYTFVAHECELITICRLSWCIKIYI